MILSYIIDTAVDQVQDSERNTKVQEPPDMKQNDETLGEENNNHETLGEMSHAPHGEEEVSVVKGPTHSGSGVPQESIHLLQYLILLGLCVVL